MKIQTTKIRAEIKNNYFFIRNLESDGGVIDSLLNKNQLKKVSNILENITTEKFIEVWEKINKIKGIKVDYANN